MTAASNRPRVICHMAASIDGRIDPAGWPDTSAMRRLYEQVHGEYDADGWLCGRVTMEPMAGGLRDEAEVAREHTGGAREDFRAPGAYEPYAFALDASGRLAWETNDLDGDHVVAILSERVSDDYLAMLRERGVSYLLCGAREVDLAQALEKIGTSFGVRTLLLEGGGRINGGLLAAGLIDEVSLLVLPLVDGRVGTPAVFDVDDEGEARSWPLELDEVQRREGGVLWLRYRVVGR